MNTALILIDLQRDFCAQGGYAHRAGLDISRMASVLRQARRLLDAARQAGWLVVHTREGHRPDLSDCPPTKLARSHAAGAPIGSPGPLGRLLVRGEHGHDFVDEVAPVEGEVVIDKPGYGAFHHTRLEQVLTRHGIERLIVAGVTIEVCVHSTLREAVDRGYACVTVSDATAASQAELQAPALAMIGVEGGIFGQVLSTDELLSEMRASAPSHEVAPGRVSTWVQAFQP